MSENTVENLKLTAGAAKAPIGIVPMHALYGVARVLEDSACKYAPFNYMAQACLDALESYDSAELRHRIACTELGGRVTLESYAAPDPDSGLPHIFHRISGLLILATLMIHDGVIPMDPGQGKRKQAKDAPPVDPLEAMMRRAPEDFKKGPVFQEYKDACDACGIAILAGKRMQGQPLWCYHCEKRHTTKADELGAKAPRGGGSDGMLY